MANWQTHRFGDMAAVSAGQGETIYLTEKEARRMAKALTAVAKSIKAQRFVDSPSLTVSGAAVSPGRENVPLPRMNRTEEGKTLGYGKSD